MPWFLHFLYFMVRHSLQLPVLSCPPPLQGAFLWQMLEDRRKSHNLSSISNEFFSYNYLIRADKTGGSVYDTLAPTAEVRALLITHGVIYTQTHTCTHPEAYSPSFLSAAILIITREAEVMTGRHTQVTIPGPLILKTHTGTHTHTHTHTLQLTTPPPVIFHHLRAYLLQP